MSILKHHRKLANKDCRIVSKQESKMIFGFERHMILEQDKEIERSLLFLSHLALSMRLVLCWAIIRFIHEVHKLHLFKL